MKIALGCGKRNYGNDWLHIDGGLFPHVHYYDVVNLPCEDNSADLIYACHLLEYFDRDEAMYVLKRWRDKLKDGGILRLAVPDFEVMNQLYLANKCSLREILGPMYGKWGMNGKYVYHKTVYNFFELTELLCEVGFSDVHKYDWKNTEHAHIDDHSQAYMCPKGDKENGTLISLNVEATKWRILIQ